MRQTVRFILKPNTFFNQLQWSRNHWWIILAFLGLATVETQIGRHVQLYHAFALLIEAKLGFSYNIALWLTMATRLAILLAGAFLISSVIYIVGSVVGRSNSRRVLFRRLSVVFTVFLGGLTLQHFAASAPWVVWASWGLCAWALFLGYVAIKEQFELGNLETAIVAIFAILMVTTTWQFSNRFFDATIRDQINQIAKQPSQNQLNNRF